MEGIITLNGLQPWIVLGVLVALLAWETFLPFFRFTQSPGRVWHAVRNLIVGAVNAALIAVVFVALWLAVAEWAERNGFGLLNLVDLPWWVRLAAACLLLDVWTYFWHLMNHRIPLLWRFHRMHHSDPWMDVTTASRFHIGEIVLSSLLRIPLIALLGVRLEELAIYEVLMFAVVQFHHANVGLPAHWDLVLRGVIVTPFMHKVHHSRWRPETDSNYGSFLSVWDRLFGSFRLNERPGDIVLGLDEHSDKRSQTLLGLLLTPWTGRRVEPPGDDAGEPENPSATP